MTRKTVFFMIAFAIAAAMTLLGTASAFAELPETLEGAGATTKAKQKTEVNELVSGTNTIDCKTAASSGTVGKTGEATAATLKLTGCASKKLACETLGVKKEGEIEAKGTGLLVTVELSGGKLGLGGLVSITGELHIECGAGTLLILVKGSVIGEFLGLTVEEHSGVLLSLFTANTPYEAALEQKEGKQAIVKCVSPKADCEKEDILLVNFGKGYADAALLSTGLGEASGKVHIDY